MTSAPGVRQDHAAAEDGDGDAVLVVQLAQQHLHRPLAAPVPARESTGYLFNKIYSMIRVKCFSHLAFEGFTPFSEEAKYRSHWNT